MEYSTEQKIDNRKFIMERWLSGRKHHTANVARGKTLRGFESLPLRKWLKKDR